MTLGHTRPGSDEAPDFIPPEIDIDGLSLLAVEHAHLQPIRIAVRYEVLHMPLRELIGVMRFLSVEYDVERDIELVVIMEVLIADPMIRISPPKFRIEST